MRGGSERLQGRREGERGYRTLMTEREELEASGGAKAKGESERRGG